jgi:hypothetical protein
MSFEFSAKRAFFALIVPAALALGGCAGDGSVKSAAEVVGLATTAQESKKFVQETRPADPNYIPVGTVVTRTAKRKTVDEFKALEAQLEAKRQANDAAGAQAKVLGTTAPPKPADAQPTN